MRVEGRIGFAPALSDKRCRIDPQSPVWSGAVRPPQPRFAPFGLRRAPQALTRSSGPADGSARIEGSIRLVRRRGPEICEGELTSMRLLLEWPAWRPCTSSRHRSRRGGGAGLRQPGESRYAHPYASPTPGPRTCRSPRRRCGRWRLGLVRCWTRSSVRASERMRT